MYQSGDLSHCYIDEKGISQENQFSQGHLLSKYLRSFSTGKEIPSLEQR